MELCQQYIDRFPKKKSPIEKYLEDIVETYLGKPNTPETRSALQYQLANPRRGFFVAPEMIEDARSVESFASGWHRNRLSDTEISVSDEVRDRMHSETVMQRTGSYLARRINLDNGIFNQDEMRRMLDLEN